MHFTKNKKEDIDKIKFSFRVDNKIFTFCHSDIEKICNNFCSVVLTNFLLQKNKLPIICYSNESKYTNEFLIKMVNYSNIFSKKSQKISFSTNNIKQYLIFKYRTLTDKNMKKEIKYLSNKQMVNLMINTNQYDIVKLNAKLFIDNYKTIFNCISDKSIMSSIEEICKENNKKKIQIVYNFLVDNSYIIFYR